MQVAQGLPRVEKLRDLVARLHALPRRRLTLLVGVDGPAAAGKTTFTRALAALDPGLDVVQMEDFALPSSERQQRGEPPVDRVAADMDWRRLRSHLLMPLGRDQPARFQRYDRSTDALAEWRMVPVGGIVIVEGRYACARPLAGFYDFRVWVDSPRDVRLRRVKARYGGSGDPAVWERVWLPVEEAYVAAQDSATTAQLRVDGSGAVAHDPTREYVRIRE